MKNNEERKTEKKRKKRFVPYEASVNITCILYIMDACTIHMVNHHTKNFVLNKNVFCGRGEYSFTLFTQNHFNVEKRFEEKTVTFKANKLNQIGFHFFSNFSRSLCSL